MTRRSPVSVEEIAELTAATRRGVRSALLVADLPFGSYEASDEQADPHRAALRQRSPRRRGQARGRRRGAALARARDRRGRHPDDGPTSGLTPQTATALGGRRAQGRTAERALAVAAEALALEEAGAFAVVFEAIPASVAAEITALLEIPVIGIGAGSATDGQVLVLPRHARIYPGRAPRFAKQYVELRTVMTAAVSDYGRGVRTRRFPTAEHSFSIDPAELRGFREGLAEFER